MIFCPFLSLSCTYLSRPNVFPDFLYFSQNQSNGSTSTTERWFFYAHTCLTMYFASCGRGAIRFCSGTRNTMRNCGHLGQSTCRTGSISDGRCVLYKRTRYLASRGAGHPRCTVFRPLISIFLVSHYFPFFSDFSDFCLFQLFSVL